MTRQAGVRPQRVLVIGAGGAGKTTVALALGDLLRLPVVHLDSLYWRAGWTQAPAAEWHARLTAALRQPAWVMDGNYGGTLARRVEAAEAIVFLDMPRAVCLARVLKRRFAYRGRVRPSMADGCPERLTLEFLYWIWTYRRRRRGQILAMLEEVRPHKEVAILTSSRDVRRYLDEVARREAVE